MGKRGKPGKAKEAASGSSEKKIAPGLIRMQKGALGRAPPHQRFSMSLRWMIKKKKHADLKVV